MFTELVEYGCKIEEKVKAMKNEMKENVHRTNSNGKETRTQINSVNQKEEKHPTRKEWRNKNSKNEERLKNLQHIFKHSNIQIIGVPEGKEEEQEIENLFEQIIKENFPNLARK